MNRIRSAVLAFGLFIVPSPDRSQVSPDRLDALFLPLVSEGSPGFAVGFIHDGRLDLSRTYGLADLVTGARITESTCFRLASLTKQFTAAAIILLVRDGRDLTATGKQNGKRHWTASERSDCLTGSDQREESL